MLCVFFVLFFLCSKGHILSYQWSKYPELSFKGVAYVIIYQNALKCSTWSEVFKSSVCHLVYVPTSFFSTSVTFDKIILISPKQVGDRFENVSWTASSEFGTYRLCEKRRFRRACASAQSRQNLRCSLIEAVSQEEPSDRKPDPWPL